MAEVTVLLATYNGGRFLPELLGSLVAQDVMPARLVARDDGSSDDTVLILRKFARTAPFSVEVNADGRRLGPYDSFWEMLRTSDGDGVTAFADQDDVWLPDKLARASAALARASGPAAYGADVLVSDTELRALRVPGAPRGGPSFTHALFETLCPLATTALNALGREHLLARLPDRTVYADLWCYQVFSGTATWLWDPRPAMRYRQHTSNTLGSGRTTTDTWRRRFRRGGRGTAGLTTQHWAQLEALQRIIGEELSPERRVLLAELIATQTSRAAAVRWATRRPIRRRSRLDAAVLRAFLAVSKPAPHAPARSQAT